MSREKSYQNLLYILKETNPYIILGVEESADQETINKVYRELAKNYHPDVFQHLRGSTEHKDIEALFQKITNAFNNLKDPRERKKLDAQLNWQRNQEQEKGIVNTEIKPVNTASPDFFFSQAGTDVKKAEDTRKEREQRLFEEAKQYIAAKNYDEAVKILKSLVDRNPKEPHFHSYLGLAMMGKGWDGYAQAEFKVALHFDSKDPVALKNYKGAVVNSNQPKPPEKEEKKGFFQNLFRKK